MFPGGNWVGDGGGTLRVNATDLGPVKRELNATSSITGRYDFNRDGRVNALDLGIVKANLNRSLALGAGSPILPVAAPEVVVAGDGGTPVRRVWDETTSDVMA